MRPLPRILAPLFARDAAPPSDRAAFLEHTRVHTLDTARFLLVFVQVFAFGWWPIDYIAHRASPAVIAASFHWRMGILAIGVVSLAAFHFSRWCQRHVFLVALLSEIGHSLILEGLLAPLGGAAEPWFYSSLLVPPATLALLLPPLRRLGAVLLVSGACMVGAFAFAPESLEHPHVGTAVGMVGFAAAASMVVGHVVYALVRYNFYQGLALKRANAALALDNASLADQLAEQLVEVRRLATHMEATREEERRRIAHELHDDLGQSLTAMRLDVDRARKNLGVDGAKVADSLGRVSGAVSSQIERVRRIVSEMRPQVLDDLGLVAAVEWLAADVRARGVDVRLSVSPEDLDVPGDLATPAYRVVQEAVNNALKHASPRRLELRLQRAGRELVVGVRDDGPGLPPASATSPRRGLGLLGMKERARALGGTLELRDARPGAEIELRVPWPAVEERAKEGA